MFSIGRQTGRGWGIAALVLAVGAAGCDSLLEVDLPAAVTSDALDNAGSAPILVNAVMAQFECGYSSFLMDASGYEDNFQMVSGVAGNYSQYASSAGGGQCDTDAYSQEWIDPFLIARAQGADTYNKMVNDWGSTQKLIGTDAFYVAAILDVFGEYFCEAAISTLTTDGGFLTPTNTLDSAEAWVQRTLDAVTANGGDFAITTAAGTHTTSIQTAALGLRARIRWARNGAGDLAAAAADAALVPDGHKSLVLREAGEKRRNMVSVFQSGGAGIQSAGFLQGPVKLKSASNTYGITTLGSHPNGTAWTSPLPFTGYLGLSIVSATGEAVIGGVPVDTTVAGTVRDTRVAYARKNTAGGLDNVPQRYPNDTDDIPLINWKEMRLIRAEAAGNTAAGIAHVNAVRAADSLPLIQGAYETTLLGDADAYQDLLIEERRRALFEEGRFWSTKIRWNEKLWFPRSVGDLINTSASYTFGGGVRILFDANEYQVNTNWVAQGGLAARGTGCDPYEAPVGF
jgi:hypothetical protein